MESEEHKYFLTFAMKTIAKDGDKEMANNTCPLDNTLIHNQYIEDKGQHNWMKNSNEMRQFKCFSLHSIVNGKDINGYTYGDIGYDLNPESMKVYLGGWSDLRSAAQANVLSNNDILHQKKLGRVYLCEDGKVYDKMNQKVLNRAKLLLDAVKKQTNVKLGDIKQYVFQNSNKDLDDSFDDKQYEVVKNTVKNTNPRQEVLKINGTLPIDKSDVSKTYDKYGIDIGPKFELSYDFKTGQLYMKSSELNGVAKNPEKGIKVDRIFIRKEKLDALKKLQATGKTRYNAIYDKYINKLTEVLVEQFPFGNIRVIEGQDFKFLEPKTFIEQYFINEEDKKKYLEKLEENKKIANEETSKNEINNTTGNEFKNLDSQAIQLNQ